MADIKNSSFLEAVFTYAKRASDGNSVTVDRFLLALIEVSSAVSGVAGEEKRVKELIAQNGLDSDDVRKKLAERATKSSYIDSMKMQKLMFNAKVKAEKGGATELTADIVLECAMSDISEMLNRSSEEKGILTSETIKNFGKQDFDIKSDTEEKSEPEVTSEPEIKSEAQPVSVKEALDNDISDVKRVRNILKSKIFGQDHAINVFTTAYFQSKMLSKIDKERKRPRATFLFAGPPGVGKTYLAEQIAELLGLPYMRFDMSEYSTREASVELCGSDKVYKDSDGGLLTKFVDKNPECILLFDEIEKAHINVIHLFLQMLDAGRLRDSHSDKEVSFTNAIIIMTTNAGRSLYKDSETTDFSSVSRKVVVKAIQEDTNPETGAPFFPSALCSRFASSNVIMFNHIGADYLRTIAKNEIGRQAENLKNETGIEVAIDDKVYSALLFAEGSNADARTIRGRSEAFFNDELYELFRLVASDKLETGINEVEKINVSLDLASAPDYITTLFDSLYKPEVMIFADDAVAAECTARLPDLKVVSVNNYYDAIDAMKENDLSLALVDIKCGASEGQSDKLNIEDVESEARKFLKFLSEGRKALPLYLLDDGVCMLDEEEKVSLVKQGVRRVIPYKDANYDLGKEIGSLLSVLHQQSNLRKLARANKIVTFETSQSISKDGKCAEIKLFDFKMETAVDASDSKNVLSAVSRPNVRFDEVIGANDAKEELKYFVEYLKNPKRYMGTGVKPPKGVLLYGPPGTGKTMLAKAVAAEADVTFIATQGNAFRKKYVGEGAEAVAEIFRTARKYAPTVLFIDEIDAIAKERNGGFSDSSGVEATLTRFLTEMDGFEVDPTRPVFVLAATNFDVTPGTPKSLDAALLRRFDRRIYIDVPEKADRIRFLRMKIEKNPALAISEDEIENIAVRSTGMSLASLDSVIELALRSAIRKGSTVVTDEIFEDAFETFNSGDVKKWDASQLERVARHEAGHAFLCWHSGETPSYLTVVARGNHGGYMQHADNEGKAIYTKGELLARIRTSLGGRAAELVYYGEKDGITTGASGDLESATYTAKNIVCRYGMDGSFGLAVANPKDDSPEVRKVVNAILDEQLREAIRIISENKSKIDALVDALMNKNHLSGKEIDSILK